MRATVEVACRFYAVTDNRAATMGAGRGQCVDRTLETVEYMRSACPDDLEGLVIAFPQTSHCAILLPPSPVYQCLGQRWPLIQVKNRSNNRTAKA
jgi:hypothetical protein